MSVRSFGENIHRNVRTMSYEALVNLIQARQLNKPISQNDLNNMWFMQSSLVDKHRTSMSFGDGFLDGASMDTHKSHLGMYVKRPRYCKPYDVLHDNSAAGGLTFPQTNRMFGGGAQSDGIGGIRLDSDDIQFTEYTVAFWLKMSLARNSGIGKNKCPIGFTDNNVPQMTLQTRAPAFNINILAFYPNSYYDFSEIMPYEFIPDVWQHHVLTAKDGEQCVYLDGVKVEFAAGLGQIPIINITSKRATILGRTTPLTAPLFDGDKMAWVSICKGIADQTWVTNDYNGLRDFSDASPVEEITTMPFMGDLGAWANAYTGLLYG